MSKKTILPLRLLLGLGVLLSSTSAFAQIDPRAEPPAGVRLGAFVLQPQVNVSAAFDDNVFATETNEEEDQSVILDVRGELESTWSIHALELDAQTITRTASDFSGLNYTNWRLGARGRYDATANVSFSAGARYARENEPLSEAPTVGLAEPVQFDEIETNVGARIAFARSALSGGVTFATADYDDAVNFAGQVVDQDDRDRDLIAVATRYDYELSPATAVFGAVGYNERQYDTPAAGAALRRDSDGYDAVAGVRFELTRLIEGEVGLGWFTQDYEAPGAEDVDGLRVNANLSWRPDALVQVDVRANRNVADPGVAEATGLVRSAADATVTYEFRRNLSFIAGAGYEQDEYEGIDRTDERLGASIGARYNFVNGLGVNLSYGWQSQDASGAAGGRNYDKNVLSVGLSYRR